MSSPTRSRRRRELRRRAQCPDCNSDVRIVRDGPCPQVEVRHDETCPTWRAANAGRPYREIRIQSRVVA